MKVMKAAPHPEHPAATPNFSVKVQEDPWVWVVVEFNPSKLDDRMEKLVEELAAKHGSPNPHVEGEELKRMEFFFSDGYADAGEFARKAWIALGRNFYMKNSLMEELALVNR